MTHDKIAESGPPPGDRERVYRLLEQAPLDNQEAQVCELFLEQLAAPWPLSTREKGWLQDLWAKHMEAVT